MPSVMLLLSFLLNLLLVSRRSLHYGSISLQVSFIYGVVCLLNGKCQWRTVFLLIIIYNLGCFLSLPISWVLMLTWSWNLGKVLSQLQLWIFILMKWGLERMVKKECFRYFGVQLSARGQKKLNFCYMKLVVICLMLKAEGMCREY